VQAYDVYAVNRRNVGKDEKSNENASQPPLEIIYESTSDEHVIYANIVPEKDIVDESSFSSNQPQPDVIYSDLTPTEATEPQAIYANNTA